MSQPIAGRRPWLPFLAFCLILFLLASCQMSDPTNFIYREAPETYFADPALAAAKAVRAEDAPALDEAFAQHPDLDPNQPGKKGVTLLLWAYAHYSFCRCERRAAIALERHLRWSF